MFILEFLLILGLLLFLLLSLNYVFGLFLNFDRIVYFTMQVLDFVLKNLWMVVADYVQHLTSPFEDLRMCREAYLKHLGEMVHEDTIVHKYIARQEIEEVSCRLLL